MASKQIVIEPRDRGFGMTPLFPEVKPGWESLDIRVDWNLNGGCWNEVVVTNFRLADGSAAKVNTPSMTFDLGDANPQKLLFNFKVASPTHCKFDVVLRRVDPQETMLIDPGIILQPGP
jgi:hypothetical protein